MEHPRLLLRAADRKVLAERTQTPDGAAIRRRLDALLLTTPEALNIGFFAAGYALRAWLDGSEADAAKALDLVDAALTDRLLHYSNQANGEALWNGNYKMILRTDPAVGVAFAYDFCHDLWPERFCQRVAAALLDRAQLFNRGGGQGWNPNPVSNWTANTGAAAGLCALAILDDPGMEGARAALQRAVERVHAYLAHQGTRGWTQEPFKYYRYPLCHHLLPFLNVYRGLVNDAEFAGGPADWLALLYTMAVRPGADFVPMVHGGQDLHHSHFRGGDFAMGLGTVPAIHRPAAAWIYRARHGGSGDATYDIALPHHAMFALRDYPDAAVAENPDGHLSRVWYDERKGLVIARDRWNDANDVLCCVDANQFLHAGSGVAPDAGGFALVGLGANWLVSRDAPKAERGQFNVVQTTNMDTRAEGRITKLSASPDGSFSTTLDLSGIYGTHAERDVLLRMHPSDDIAAELAVEDRIPGMQGQWVVHTPVPPELLNGGWISRTATAALQATIHGNASPVFTPLTDEKLTIISVPFDSQLRVVFQLRVVPRT